MGDYFRFETFFSLGTDAKYFQIAILMAGEYISGQKNEIKGWHELRNLIQEIRDVGAMSVLVPPITSSKADNSWGISKLKAHKKTGEDTGFLKVDQYVDRGMFTRKLMFSKLVVFKPNTQQDIFTLRGEITNVGDIEAE